MNGTSPKDTGLGLCQSGDVEAIGEAIEFGPEWRWDRDALLSPLHALAFRGPQ